MACLDKLEVDIDLSKCEAVVDGVSHAIKVSEEAAVTLKALCEVMNVDPDAMKEQMVINALKNDGKGYPGDLYTDAIEVIGTLRRARDDYRERLDKSIDCNKEQHEALVDVKNKYMKEIDKGTKILNTLNQSCYYILGKFPDKRRYTKNDMLDAQADIVNQLGEHHNKIIKILTEETKQQ